MPFRQAERFRLTPRGEPLGVGPLDVAYDVAFELIVEPAKPFGQQHGLLVVRVTDTDAEILAEGRVTDPTKIKNLTARAAYFAQESLRTTLAGPGSPERVLLQIPSTAIKELSEVEPARVEIESWVNPVVTAAPVPPKASEVAAAPYSSVAISVDASQAQRVFVVHGRNLRVRDDFFSLLRTFGVEPIEWSEAIRETGKASPYVGEILDTAFSMAQAVTVLFTPDDEVRLTASLHSDKEPAVETAIHLQPRPNVLFEAGMAFGRQPDRTVLVEVGSVKPFSDVAGRHVVRLTNAKDRRLEIGSRLQVAGCPVRLDSPESLSVGNFELGTNSAVTAIDKAPSQGTTVTVRWVDIKFPHDSGLQSKLEADGYEVRWAREDKVARRVDLEGWEPVVEQPTSSGPVTYQVRDPMSNLVLLRRKKTAEKSE